MTRILTIGLASALALASLTGVVLANERSDRDAVGLDARRALSHEDELTDQTAASATTGSGSAYQTAAATTADERRLERLIRHWKGGFAVEPVGFVTSNGEAAAIEMRANEPRRVAALQTAIEHNHALDGRLKARDVEIRNIVDADRSANGGLTFYVR